MSISKFTKNVSIHQGMPDKPALTSTELKQAFDSAPEAIKEYLNITLIPEVEALIDSLVKTADIVNNFNGGNDKVASAELAKTLNNSISTINTQLTTLNTSINSLSSSKENAISYGTSAPSSLSNGQKYIQYF